MRRRGGNSWVALARATPEPGGNRNPQKSHSIWTRRERGKTCPELKETHREGKRAFLLETHPDKHHGQPTCLIYEHQSQPPCVIVPRSPCCPQGHAVAGPAATWECGWGELNTSSLEMEQKPGKRSSIQGHQHDGKHPPALRSPQEGDKAPPALPLSRRGCSREGSARRDSGNCPRSLLSLAGLWNNQR